MQILAKDKLDLVLRADHLLEIYYKHNISIPLKIFHHSFVVDVSEHEELVEFAMSLLRGTRRNRPELDELLGSRADNWSLRRMAATDRNILRLAAFELLYTSTPDRVVINEAVELAKRFGSKQSAQFVNGVLDSLLPDRDSGNS